MDKTQILNWLKENLDTERFEHSLGVAETAQTLALKYNENPDKAYLTGLIHDCAKCLSPDENADILTNNEIQFEPEEMSNKKTIHAPIGSYIAKKIFKINDNEILSAIRWHTIGKKDMTTFEKIIYLADKIEHRTRPKEFTDIIESQLDNKNGLELAILECFKLTISSLTERNLVICAHTIDVYNYFLMNYKQ